mmetsp:Transcript_20052/g.58626  ORF Transcript_20052/g.58626 Transcript_20052/m.58626 type:complete len:104 (+) Transcript_20052:49-360(+)
MSCRGPPPHPQQQRPSFSCLVSLFPSSYPFYWYWKRMSAPPVWPDSDLEYILAAWKSQDLRREQHMASGQLRETREPRHRHSKNQRTMHNNPLTPPEVCTGYL